MLHPWLQGIIAHVAALVNDTAGLLAAARFVFAEDSNIAMIIGTGTCHIRKCFSQHTLDTPAQSKQPATQAAALALIAGLAPCRQQCVLCGAAVAHPGDLLTPVQQLDWCTSLVALPHCMLWLAGDRGLLYASVLNCWAVAPVLCRSGCRTTDPAPQTSF